MTTLADVPRAWEVSEPYPTVENLDAWTLAAVQFSEAGGLLPPSMRNRYRLTTGAQLLPAAVITAAPVDDAPMRMAAVLAVVIALVVVGALDAWERALQ